MSTFLSTDSIPNVTIAITLNGRDFSPADYAFGALKDGAKIQIGLEVAENVEHLCYTLNAKLEKVSKSAVRPGMYVKNYTVRNKRKPDGTRTSQIAGWPSNIIILEIEGHTYNIGIFGQNGRYFFAIHEAAENEPSASTPLGTILDFNPLHGIGVVWTGKLFSSTKVHWSRLPFRRELGFRAVVPGEVLKYTKKDLKPTGAEKTIFGNELMYCKL